MNPTHTRKCLYGGSPVSAWTVLLLWLTCLISGISCAQDQQGVSDSVFSTVLGEKRMLRVVVPENQTSAPDAKYDVIYVLDGPGNLDLFSRIHTTLREWNEVPPLIFVSIPNTDRNRDFLPTKNGPNSTAGGADNFIRFIQDELQPHINKKYPVSGYNILYGHSFGGVLAMHTLLTKPDLFEAYIAADPSFWWDNGIMNKFAKEKLPALAGKQKTLFISGREGQGYSGMQIDVMDSVLTAYKPNSVSWKSVAYPDESHGTVRFKTIYDGLRYVYEGTGGAALVFHPQSGIVSRDGEFNLFLISGQTSARYTTDGTEPTLESPKMEQLVQLKGPATVTVKTFTRRGNQYDKVVIGKFTEGETFPPLKKPKKVTSGGLAYSYYEGTWKSLPDFSNLKPSKTGKLDSTFRFENLPSKENYGCLFTGYLEIEKDGHYIFGLDSDDGSKFYLADKLLIDNDGLHATGNTRSSIVPLAKGFYPVRIEYFQGAGRTAVDLVYLPPGTRQPEKIPFERLYSK